MDTDLREQIDRSFGDGPPHPPHDRLLERGHVALRRRRLVESGSAVLVAVVAVAAAALVATEDGDGAAPPPAQAPTASPGPTTPTVPPSTAIDPAPTTPPSTTFPPPVGAPVVRDRHLPMDWAVAAQRDGLHVAPGVTVLRVVDDPWHYRERGAWSVALAYRGAKGAVTWWAGFVDHGGGGTSSEIARSETTMGFDAWVQAQDDGLDYARGGTTAAPDPAGGWPGKVRDDLVRFAGPDSERLVPLDAVVLIAQRRHPDLPEGWARPGDRSAAAEVRFEGLRYYVLARSTGTAQPEVVAVESSKGGPTLDDFLDLARQRYAEGGGGLL